MLKFDHLAGSGAFSVIKISYSYVNTAVYLRYLDFKETLGEKERWELHKGATCCLE